MLHVASAHSSPRWLQIQRRALAEHIHVPYMRWGSVALIDSAHASEFDRAVEQKGPEAGKLNHLALEIAREAADQDLLMFLAPDAFPVADPMGAIERALAEAPLLAVRRAENDGDPLPHPCFCVTTVGAWRELAGDWSDGYPFSAPGLGRVTDFGANLLRRLELTGTPWVALERTSGTPLDPLRFAVYGGIVYFHNAAEIGRVHRLQAPRPLAPARPGLLGRALAPVERQRRLAWERALLLRSSKDSEEIFSEIAAGGTAWLERVGHTAAAG
jgi:hypothetical protein